MASGTCESQSNVQTVRVNNLQQNTTYSVSSSITNAGRNYGSLMTVKTPMSLSATSQSDTKTATPQSDTKTATTQSDTKTATTQSDTKTATTQTLTNNSSPVVQNETITATIATIIAMSNVESRTASTVNLLKTLSAPEKESLLDVTMKSTKSAVINIDVVIPDIKVVITATKSGSKPIVFTLKTDVDGEGQIKTSKNLNGYTVTLAVNGVKLDSDKATKK